MQDKSLDTNNASRHTPDDYSSLTRRNEMKKDRPHLISVSRVQRGFIATMENHDIGQISQYAFDRIEDFLEWLIEQMGGPEGEA